MAADEVGSDSGTLCFTWEVSVLRWWGFIYNGPGIYFRNENRRVSRNMVSPARFWESEGFVVSDCCIIYLRQMARRFAVLTLSWLGRFDL